jgi:hypothetical protein
MFMIADANALYREIARPLNDCPMEESFRRLPPPSEYRLLRRQA